jgi:hypothetical protein
MAGVPPSSNAVNASGNTLYVRWRRVAPSKWDGVFLTLAALNPRVYQSLHVEIRSEEAERKGHLRPALAHLEARGCITASSPAFICTVDGYKFHMAFSTV